MPEVLSAAQSTEQATDLARPAGLARNADHVAQIAALQAERDAVAADRDRWMDRYTRDRVRWRKFKLYWEKHQLTCPVYQDHMSDGRGLELSAISVVEAEEQTPVAEQSRLRSPLAATHNSRVNSQSSRASHEQLPPKCSDNRCPTSPAVVLAERQSLSEGMGKACGKVVTGDSWLKRLPDCADLTDEDEDFFLPLGPRADADMCMTGRITSSKRGDNTVPPAHRGHVGASSNRFPTREASFSAEPVSKPRSKRLADGPLHRPHTASLAVRSLSELVRSPRHSDRGPRAAGDVSVLEPDSNRGLGRYAKGLSEAHLDPHSRRASQSLHEDVQRIVGCGKPLHPDGCQCLHEFARLAGPVTEVEVAQVPPWRPAARMSANANFLEASEYSTRRQLAFGDGRVKRPRTPPGFWDVDFPTTQQVIVEREENETRLRREAHKRKRI